jgi:hypothetical protein
MLKARNFLTSYFRLIEYNEMNSDSEALTKEA